MPKPVTPPDPKVTPKPELEKRTRRVFTADYKLRIVQEAAACKHGELGKLLRREGLYANQLAQWRREFAEQGVAGLEKSRPGPRPAMTAEQKRIQKLERENERLREELELKDLCLELQKKVSALIETSESQRS